jgi:hypothetical protein
MGMKVKNVRMEETKERKGNEMNDRRWSMGKKREEKKKRRREEDKRVEDETGVGVSVLAGQEMGDTQTSLVCGLVER